jgi:hypothetical protein
VSNYTLNSQKKHFLTKWCAGKVSGYIPNTVDKTSESHEECLKNMKNSSTGDAGSEQGIIVYPQWDLPFMTVGLSQTHFESASDNSLSLSHHFLT